VGRENAQYKEPFFPNGKNIQKILTKAFQQPNVTKALEESALARGGCGGNASFSLVQRKEGIFLKIGEQRFPVHKSFSQKIGVRNSLPHLIEKTCRCLEEIGEFQADDLSPRKEKVTNSMQYLQSKVGINAIPDDLDVKTQGTVFKSFRKWLRLYLPLADDVIALTKGILELFKVEHEGLQALDRSASIVDVLNNILRLRSGYKECKNSKKVRDLEGGVGGSLLIGRGITSLFGIAWLTIPFAFTALSLPTLGVVGAISALSPVGWGCFLVSYTSGAMWYTGILARSLFMQMKINYYLRAKDKYGKRLTKDECYRCAFKYLKNQIVPTDVEKSRIIEKIDKKKSHLDQNKLNQIAYEKAKKLQGKKERIFSRRMGAQSLYLLQKGVKKLDEDKGNINDIKKVVNSILLEGKKRQILLAIISLLLVMSIVMIILFLCGVGGYPLLIMGITIACISLAVTLYEIYQKKRGNRYKLLLAEGDNLEIGDIM